jgi:hypothetical protein
MVYLTLLILILGSSLLVMLMANRFFVSTLDNNAVQREAQTTMMRLSRELEESKAGSVILSADDQQTGLVFLSPRNLDGEFVYDYSSNGDLFWHKWICYYVANESDKPKLYRAEQALLSPATAPENTLMTPTDFQLLTGTREIVAHDLLSFEIQSDLATTNTYNIRASFGREGRRNNTDGDRIAETVDIENSVHLRN